MYWEELTADDFAEAVKSTGVCVIPMGVVERITYPGSGLSRGSVIQVMTTVAEHLSYCMAEGQSVTLDCIGTFTPRSGRTSLA